MPKKATPMLRIVKTDGWENIITSIGTSRDKRLGGRIKAPVPNVSYREFENLYFGSDLAATAAELPAREMIRAWITITANDPGIIDENARTDPEEKSTTEESVSIGKKINQRLQELEAQAKSFEAMVWARVFGGGLLFLGIDDGGGDNPESLKEPLNEDRIDEFKFLTVFDRWDVHIAQRYTNPTNPKFGQPELYRINAVAFEGQGNAAAGADLIHETRFIRFDGVLTNRRRQRENGGWSDSIFTRTQDLIRDYDISWHGIANMLQDFSQAVFKMRGLRDAMLQDKDDLVLRRMTLIDQCRSIGRAVPLDAEDEDFNRHQTPVSGLPDLMDRFALRMSAAFRMPATLLFGQSPAGMQATGASDIRFFYDQVSSNQETMLRPKLERLIRLVMLDKSGPTKGQEPEDWAFTFNPLFQLTEQEQAELRNKQADTDQKYLTEGVVTEDEIAYSRFGGGEYSPETILDLEQRNEDKLADEAEPEPEPMPIPPIPPVQPPPVEPTPEPPPPRPQQ
jgi:phage-related protein (TIGR01555 family)